MEYFSSFMATSGTPKEDILEQMQEMVNEQFEVASSVQDDIYQEVEFGTLQFKKIEARITHLINSATGDRVGDDFKKITFKDLSFKPKLGSRYKFDENIWLVYATDNIKSATSACYVRRCNNTMGMLDKYGNVHREPCYIEYKPTKTSVGEYDNITLPFTKQILYCQLNDWTKNVGISSRFMFGGDVFKISDRVKFNQTETFNANSAAINRYYMDYDNKNEYDNETLQVADYKLPDYTISVQSPLIVQANATATLTATVLLDNVQVDEDVVWYSSNTQIITVNKDTGEYVAKANGNAIIYAKLKGNEYFQSAISVEVVSPLDYVYESKITPFETYIPLGTTQNYAIYKYCNGVPTEAIFTITASQLDNSYFDLTIIDGNHFSIKNKKQNNDTLLKVVAETGNALLEENTVTIYIELGGIF